MEVTFPLLEEIDLAELEPSIEEETEELLVLAGGKSEKGGSPKKGANVGDKQSSKSKKSSRSQKSKNPGPYAADDEYEKEVRLRIRNPSIKTDKVGWSKIIQFPEDAIVVDANESDLTRVRDTFRSRVNVKVVYLKVANIKIVL